MRRSPVRGDDHSRPRRCAAGRAHGPHGRRLLRDRRPPGPGGAACRRPAVALASPAMAAVDPARRWRRPRARATGVDSPRWGQGRRARPAVKVRDGPIAAGSARIDGSPGPVRAMHRGPGLCEIPADAAPPRPWRPARASTGSSPARRRAVARRARRSAPALAGRRSESPARCSAAGRSGCPRPARRGARSKPRPLRSGGNAARPPPRSLRSWTRSRSIRVARASCVSLHARGPRDDATNSTGSHLHRSAFRRAARGRESVVRRIDMCPGS